MDGPFGRSDRACDLVYWVLDIGHSHGTTRPCLRRLVAQSDWSITATRLMARAVKLFETHGNGLLPGCVVRSHVVLFAATEKLCFEIRPSHDLKHFRSNLRCEEELPEKCIGVIRLVNLDLQGAEPLEPVETEDERPSDGPIADHEDLPAQGTGSGASKITGYNSHVASACPETVGVPDVTGPALAMNG